MRIPRPRLLRAFTLIELLIVVAIIAILAAIAIPNFLEAQVRSKVSRVKADMRSVATALESYRIDNNHYPLVAQGEGQEPGDFVTAGPLDPFETFLSARITTPVAYITSLPKDVFAFKPGEGVRDATFHNNNREVATLVLGEPDFFTEITENLYGRDDTSVQYFMLSNGPDGDFDDDPDHPPGDLDRGQALYDPTNGTVTSGDVYYFGPGVGFKN